MWCIYGGDCSYAFCCRSFSESLRDRLADRDSGFSLGIVGSLNSVAVSSREADGDSWFPSGQDGSLRSIPEFL